MTQLIMRLAAGLLLAFLSACAAPPTPTQTPRPTIEPRTAPTSIPEPIEVGGAQDGAFVDVSLPGGAPVDVIYDVQEPQRVQIAARALSDDGAGNTLDLVLWVLGPDGEQIAFDDDGARTMDGFGVTDPALEMTLPTAGVYTVRINAFNGAQAGDAAVRVTELDS